jgi:geranylgeranyl pyrophosphate synthase
MLRNENLIVDLNMSIELPSFYPKEIKVQHEFFEPHFREYISFLFKQELDQFPEEYNDIFFSGRRTRPSITLAISKKLGIDLTDSSIVRRTCLVEIIHCVSIILDDLIDKDTQRRNKPTFWKNFGVEKTVLFSNLILNRFYQELSKEDQEIQCFFFESIKNTISGVLYETYNDSNYENILLKTSSLFRLCAKLINTQLQDTNNDIETMMCLIANAFQISNDIIDVSMYFDKNPRKNSLPFLDQFKNNFVLHKYDFLTDEKKSHVLLSRTSMCIEMVQEELNRALTQVDKLKLNISLKHFCIELLSVLSTKEYWYHEYKKKTSLCLV